MNDSTDASTGQTERDIWRRVELVCGDITRQDADAIVNAANSSLLGGGGVDGAIHRAAGPQLLATCRTLGGCQVGEARITPGFDLPARWVIHTVGPVYRGGQSGEPERLAGCYRSSMALAREHGCRIVAFPAISCGVYGYPIEEAANVALDAVAGELQTADLPERVRFVLFSKGDLEVYQSAIGKKG